MCSKLKTVDTSTEPCMLSVKLTLNLRLLCLQGKDYLTHHNNIKFVLELSLNVLNLELSSFCMSSAYYFLSFPSFGKKKQSISSSVHRFHSNVFFVFKVNGQAPVRAVQCLPISKPTPTHGWKCNALGLGPP